MKATVWGCRGSIPVSGRTFLKYGGDTTCLQIETRKGETVILDAGTGIHPLGIRMMELKKREFHFLLTHSHWDHMQGFPFFRPLYRKGSRILLHGCTFAQKSIKSILSQAMRAPFFPVNFKDIAANILYDEVCPERFEVGSLHCQSLPLSHPDMGYGFLIAEGRKKLAFFPDNDPLYPHEGGKTFGEYVKFFEDLDVLIHDAEYTQEEYETFSRGWGHSVYLETVRLAREAGVKKLVLWHHNPVRTDRQVDRMLRLAQKAAGSRLKCMMAYPGLTINL